MSTFVYLCEGLGGWGGRLMSDVLLNANQRHCYYFSCSLCVCVCLTLYLSDHAMNSGWPRFNWPTRSSLYQMEQMENSSESTMSADHSATSSDRISVRRSPRDRLSRRTAVWPRTHWERNLISVLRSPVQNPLLRLLSKDVCRNNLREPEFWLQSRLRAEVS